MAENEIEFGELPPKRQGGGTAWSEILLPLTKPRNRGKWARVKALEYPAQAQAAQKNLTQRKVSIPEPMWNWSFAARGVNVWAICRGPFLKGSRKGKDK